MGDIPENGLGDRIVGIDIEHIDLCKSVQGQIQYFSDPTSQGKNTGGMSPMFPRKGKICGKTCKKSKQNEDDMP